MDWTLIETDRHRWLRPPGWDWPGLVAGFTTRQHRLSPAEPWTADWSFRGPDGIATSPGFREFEVELAPPAARLITQRQVHGTSMTFIDQHSPSVVPANDALLTREPGTVCLSQSADCCVGLVVIPAQRIAGVFHAGWKGAVAGLPSAVIEALTASGYSPDGVWVALGPAIQQASYQVGAEVASQFDPAFWEPDFDTPGRFRLDLPGAIRAQLLAAGVPDSQIVVSERDTCAEPEWFHSYRRDGAGQGLQVGFCGWTPV